MGFDNTARVVVVESVVDLGSDDACVSEKMCVAISLVLMIATSYIVHYYELGGY